MIQIIGGPGGDLRAWLFDRITESRKAPRRVVLYVPEQYTLQAERDLLTEMGLPGLLDLDVISPSKLKVQIREAAGSSGRRVLDEKGRAMAVQRALQDCASSLEYYRRMEGLEGMVPQLEKTLSELREEGMTGEKLESFALGMTGARRLRLLDLSRILSAYEALLNQRFEDPASSWEDLCARLPVSGLWDGTDLYVYGFDSVRSDLRNLILSASGVCTNIAVLLNMVKLPGASRTVFAAQEKSTDALSALLSEKGVPVTVTYLPFPAADASDPFSVLERNLFSSKAVPYQGDPSPMISLYAAPHPSGEAFAIASVLRERHRMGIPWNRMAVALRGGDPALSVLTAVLRMSDIPFFSSRKVPLSRHGVSRLLSAALECVSRGLRSDPLLEMASCGFGSLSRMEGASLARYIRRWGIDRRLWRSPFTRGEDADEMETLRLRLVDPVLRLHGSLRAASGASDSVEAIFHFLQEENVYSQLLERQRELMDHGLYAEAVINRQVWETLMDILDQLWNLLGGRRATLKEISLLVGGALDRGALSSLPEEQEGVAVGEVGHMIPGRTEALVLPGMNDGVMSAPGAGLLSDPERKALEEQAGRAVGLDSEKMRSLVRFDYYRTMTLPKKRLWVSYRLRDEGGAALLPGDPVRELRRIFPNRAEQGGLSGDPYPRMPETPALALAGMGPRLRNLREDAEAKLSGPWRDALQALLRHPDASAPVRDMLSAVTQVPSARFITPETALRLFQGDRVSISRLETFAGCPRKHFLRYGLRLLTRDGFDFSPADAGDFFHLVLDRFMHLAMADPDWPLVDAAWVSRAVDQAVSGATESWKDTALSADAAGRWQGEGYLRRVRHAADVLTRFAANSDFFPAGTELPFGEQEGAPPLILTLSDGAKVALQGKIDRMDRYRAPEGDYLRILDLKSGGKKLEPAKMLRGEQLQLMIYLRAALNNSPSSLPGGAMYFPVLDREVDAPDPESAEKKRLSELQFRGVSNRAENVLRAMDRDLSPFSLPAVFNKDGSVSKSAKWALPEEILRGLTDAALKKAAALCEEIRSGLVSAAPSVENDQSSACTFCEFSAICPKQKSDERPLPKGVTFEDVASGNPGGAPAQD